MFQATGVGDGTTSGTAYTLLDATGINLGHKIQGVHLIERDVRIGATTLHSGELLLTTNQSTTIGGNALAVTQNDIVRLAVQQTSVSGPAITTASLAIDGSDLALDTSQEALKSLAFASVGTPPSVNDDIYHLTEGETFNSANLWYDSNWSSRIELTFNNSSRAENLDDFPILVTLDTNRFDYSLAKANGEDLRFVDANGQLLAHEIETWNPSGRSAIWVKVPRIDASSSTDSIQMYYGNAAAADVQNSTAVWSNGYVGVWHLNGNPSGLQTIADSSSSNVDGTSIGMDATNQVTGPIGGALKFNGTNEAIRVATTSTDPTAVDPSQLTIEAWANSTGDSGVAERIINRRHTIIVPFESYGLATSSSDRTQVMSTAGSPDLVGTVGSLPEDRWRYLTGVLSGSTSSLYVDGVLNATDTGVLSLGSSDDDITIGAGEMGLNSTLSQYWTGGIDEVRLSNVARSAAWTAAQYASMTDTLITYGERQTVTGLLDTDHSATTGGLIVSSVDLTDLGGVATATVLDDGQVSFVPGASFQSLAAGQTASKKITYTAMDQNGNTDTATATFVIHGVNDAPQINTTVGPLTLTSVIEGTTNPAGNTVLAVLTSAAGTLISDVDSGAVQGIAVTAVDTTHGTWQYSVDGTTWSSLTGVSDTNATLLNTASHVRFIPSAGFSGVAGALTFRAWDQSTGANGQSSVNVSANGGSTAFSAQTTTASITVIPLNTPPIVVTNFGMTASEGGTALLSNTRLSASDAENTPAQLIYTLTASPTNGRLERVATPGLAITTFTQADLNSNAIRYVHNGGETTSDGFSFSLSDGLASVTGSFAITVTPVNDAPVVSVNTGLTVAEGGSGVLTSTKLSASDLDNTAAQLTYTVSTIPVNGRVERVATPGVTITSFTQAEINSNAIRYVHNGGETTSDSFSFSLSDGVATVSGSIAVTVTPVNDAPLVVVNSGLTVAEGSGGVLSSTKLSASDSDSSAAQLVYTVSTSPANGRVERVATPGIAITTFTQAEINSNAIRYVHDGGETTSDGFSFSLSDGTATVTDSFVITVTAVNDAPVVSVNTGLTVVEGGNGILTSTKLAASDPDNTAAQRVFTVTASPSHGRLEKSSNPGVTITSFTQANINSGIIRYVHDGGETTSDSFSFSLTDGTASVSGSFSYSITAVNDVPVMAANLGVTLLEGGSQIIGSTRLEATDADNSSSQLVYTVLTSPTNGRLEQTTAPGVAITTFTQSDLNGNTIRYVHNGNETTSDGLSYSLSDGAATVTGSFSITIIPVNDTPVMVVNTGLTAAEGGGTVLSNTQLLTSDVDNTPSQLVYTLTTSPTNGRLERVVAPGTAITSFTQSEINSGTIRYVHDGSETTSDSFSFSLSDGTATVSSSLTITVTPVNNAPSLVTNQMTINEGQTLTLSSSVLLTTDPDTLSSSLTYTVTAATNGRFEFVASPGTATTTFTQNDIINSQVRFVHSGGEAAPTASTSVSDGTISVGPTSVLITFTNVNDPPTVSTNIGLTLSEGTTATISNAKLAASDPDNIPAQRVFTVTSSPTHGRLETSTTPGVAITSFTQAQINTGVIRYVHDGGETTTDSFNFSLSDATASVTGSFALTITPANDSPVLSTNTGVTLTEGGVRVIGNVQLGASDPDNTPTELVYAVIAAPMSGQLERVATPGSAITTFTQADLNSNAIRYVHDGGEMSIDGFSFTLSDGNSTVTGSFAITVTPVNDAPRVAVNIGLTVAEGGNAVLVSAKLAASDVDNTTAQLVYTVSTSPANGRLERVATPGLAMTTFTQAEVNSGAIRYVHNGGETTSDAFAFSISDGRATASGSFAINVTPVNDAPVITTNVGLVVVEGGTASLSSADLQSTDAETGPAGLTYTVTGGLGFGHMALASAPETSISSFTQAQLNGNQIVYVHEGAESTADYFVFSVSDGTLASTRTMSISITAVNDAPAFDAYRMTLTEGRSLTLSNYNLLANDNDTPATALIYTVNSVTNGRFETASAPGVAITSFSQDDVTNSRVVFVHNGSEAAPTAILSVTDGVNSVGRNSLLMTFSNVNDPPTITTNAGVTLNEGATTTIGSSRLTTSDPDNIPAQRVFTVTTSPAHGRLEKSNNAGVAITSFTQADINDELIRYVHDGSETTSDRFDFSVSDGVATVTGTFGVAVTPSNDSPTLTASAITVSEGQVVTLTLADLNAIDVDSGSLSFNVSAVSRGQFMDATTGSNVTSFTRAQVQSGQIRFQHNGSESPPTAAVSVSDGVSTTTPIAIGFAFSNVNDPPIAEADTIATPIASNIVLSPSILLANDSDAEQAPLTISITRTPNHGTLASNPDGTFTYHPDAGYSGSDSFEYVVSDGIASSAAAVVSFNQSVIAPAAFSNSSSTNSSSNSTSNGSGAADGGSGTTSQASIGKSPGSTSLTTGGSLIAPSPGGSLFGSHSHGSDTENLAFQLNTHDEDGIGLFLARQGHGVDEVTRTARTPQSLDATRLSSRSGEVAIGSLDSLLTGGQLAQFNDPASSMLTQFRVILASDANQNAFAEVTKSLRSDFTNELIFEIPALAGASLTVGYVVWMLRGGLLITSLLAQVPAWSIVDPLAVLDSLDKSEEDDESIGSLLEQGPSELEPVM